MNTKRMLMLALCVLLVVVAPIHTFADPPDDQCPSPFSSDGHHSYSQSRQEATCTDAGSITWVCSDCGKVYTETIPALGHSWGEWVTRQAATCTTGGTNVYTCTRCGAEEVRNIDPLGHGWDNGVVTQAPTCAAEGVRTFTCTRCGATRTEAIAKTADHTPVTVPGRAATCTEAGLTDGSKCSICGAVLKAQESIPAKGHSWDGGRVTQEATCTAEGVKNFTCSNCGATRTDTFPAKGHTPAAVPAKAATCTEPGLTEGSQCSACGTILKAQETIPAKGHAWDGGVITAEPQGFTPGVKTYTCQNDPSHTYTEPVDPTQSVFNGMSNVIPDFSSGWLMNNPVGDMLRIVTQPQGGVATEESPLVLTVEAAGGEGAYVYNWYREPAFAGMSTSVIADIVTAQGTAIAANIQAIQNTAASGLSELNQAWIDQHKIPGVTIAKPSTATETVTMTMNAQPFNPCQEFLGTSDDPKCYGYSGYRYWCVVYDEAGHHVTSDKAEVGEPLHIVRQPENANIYGRDSVALICVAAGGSGNCTYTWYDANGTPVEDQSTFKADKEGEYYCQVADFDTDEIVDSLPAQVYSQVVDMSPIILIQPESAEFEYREDGQYSWSMTCQAQAYDGSSEYLKYDWLCKTGSYWLPVGEGEALDWFGEGGIFRCTVMDTRNYAITSSNEAKVLFKLSFVNAQSLGDTAILMKKISFEFIGGEGPYSYELYTEIFSPNEQKKDALVKSGTVDSLDELQFNVQYLYNVPYYDENGQLVIGNYNIAWYWLVVTDSQGQTAKSTRISG